MNDDDLHMCSFLPIATLRLLLSLSFVLSRIDAYTHMRTRIHPRPPNLTVLTRRRARFVFYRSYI